MRILVLKQFDVSVHEREQVVEVQVKCELGACGILEGDHSEEEAVLGTLLVLVQASLA